ncbi:hypothetical protein PIB30_040638 [Stylosanthes scabra]|uniref:Uncharacterized protein n=1 Tax=Stylosanthes scabra TaxID=79078 RepID=A0ABU6VGT3_9FABA|nr:hypothetical protein [Stylosanthes scabra]
MSLATCIPISFLISHHGGGRTLFLRGDSYGVSVGVIVAGKKGAKWPPPHWQGRVGLSFIRNSSYKYMERAAKSSDQSHTHLSKNFPHLSISLNGNGRYTCYCVSQWGNITIGGRGDVFMRRTSVGDDSKSSVFARPEKCDISEFGEAGRKEVTRILKMPLRTDQNVTMMFSYHRGISSVFAVELCVQLQDVGGSSSSSNHVDSGRGININDAVCISPNRRASSPSPSFSPYVNWPAQEPPPEVSLFQDHAGVVAIHSPNLDDDQAGVNSDGVDDDEFIPETQPPNAEQALGLATIVAPLQRVSEEAGHYSIINEEAMHSGSADD